MKRLFQAEFRSWNAWAMKSVGSARRWRAISGGPPEISFNPLLPPELAGESVEHWFGRAAQTGTRAACAPNSGIRFQSKRLLSPLILAFAISALAAERGLALPGNPAGWKTLAEGGAEVELVPDFAPPAPDGQNTNALRLTVKQTGRRSGIVCADTGKLKLEPGQWYDLSFNARTGTRKTFALTVSLESPNGKKVFARTTLPEVGGNRWARFSVALHVRQPASKCRMVIALAETGTLWLNDISLVLRKPPGPIESGAGLNPPFQPK